MALKARISSFLPVGLAAVLAAGCAAEAVKRTEVVVVVDTDLTVPGQLDGLKITAVSARGEEKVARAAFERPSDLPGTLGLLHPGGALGPFRVVVAGVLGDAVVVTREAEFSFVAGATLTLSMNLLRSCVGVMCALDETCAEGGCVSKKVPTSALTPWNGKGGGLPDASVNADVDGSSTESMGDAGDAGQSLPDGGKLVDAGRDASVGPGTEDAQVDPNCVPAAELCNGLDDDCDGRSDEDFDRQSDPGNCGQCGTTCDLDNADDACSAGKCVVSQCSTGFGNCDKNDSTGCEADLNTDLTCGSCTTKCVGLKHCCNGVCQTSCP